MELSFKIRLQEFGRCIHDLIRKDKYATYLFNTLLQDCNDIKFQDPSLIKVLDINNPQIYTNTTEELMNESRNPEENHLNISQIKEFLEGIKRMEPDKNEKLQESIYNLRQKRNSDNKHYSKLFSTLNIEEKELMFYDSIALSNRQSTRKWGIHKTNITKLNEKGKLFKTLREKEDWMMAQKDIIENRMHGMDIENIISNISTKLELFEENQSTSATKNLQQLSNLAFDRGIAIAATKYSINLFELEFLLLSVYSTKWNEMSANKWYCVAQNTNHESMSKLDLAILAQKDGVEYVSKKTGIRAGTIVGYRKIYEEEGGEKLGGTVRGVRVRKDKIEDI